MMYKIALAFAALVCAVNAHMTFSKVILNGENTNRCIRPHPQSQYDYPLSDKNSKRFPYTEDMICGWPPAITSRSASKCDINAGDEITLQWWHGLTGPDDVVDGSHVGPCLVYMAKSDDGQGQVWFKIYEEGYNTETAQWCTDRIRKDGPNKGQLTVTIPGDILPGEYLLRTEFIALHEGYIEGGAQPYVGCAELVVAGSGTVDPPVKVSIPDGLYKFDDPGMYFNVYYPSPVQSYPIPGPELYVPGDAPAPVDPTYAPSPDTPSPCLGSAPCSPGSKGCPCSSGRCNNGLKCDTNVTAAGVCVIVECNVGSEGCPCPSSGVCSSPDLTCLSKVCVDARSLVKQTAADALQDGKKSNAVVVSLSFVAVVFAVAITLLF